MKLLHSHIQVLVGRTRLGAVAHNSNFAVGLLSKDRSVHFLKQNLKIMRRIIEELSTSLLGNIYWFWAHVLGHSESNISTLIRVMCVFRIQQPLHHWGSISVVIGTSRAKSQEIKEGLDRREVCKMEGGRVPSMMIGSHSVQSTILAQNF